MADRAVSLSPARRATGTEAARRRVSPARGMVQKLGHSDGVSFVRTTLRRRCRAPRSSHGRRRGRPRGSGTPSAQALALVQAKPGITIPEILACDQRQRALRGVRVGRVQPGRRRPEQVPAAFAGHLLHRRCVRARPAIAQDRARQRGARRQSERWRQRLRGGQRRRTLRGVRLDRVEPGWPKREQRRRCVRARLAVGGDRARERGRRWCRGQWSQRLAGDQCRWALCAFDSNASNLVADDTNDHGDVFVRDRQSGATERVSVAGNGEQGNDQSYFSAISADGRYLVFASDASNLVLATRTAALTCSCATAVRRHLGRSASSSVAKNTDAALRISLARRSS
jgi:hypothetical protein